MQSQNFQAAVKSMRLPFLVLTPACVLLGLGAALHTSSAINYLDLILVLIGALAAHISVNCFNEYFDFKSGLDAKTIKTPFSGGSGSLVENPQALEQVFYWAIGTLLLTSLIGVYFVAKQGLLLLPLGLVGVLVILTYTQWINRYAWLCLIAPGLGFGPLMVIGTYVVLTGEYSFFAFFVSLVPFFLANNLLLLNQFPDQEPDQSVGRNHFPIAYGLETSAWVYGAFVAAVVVLISAGVLLDWLPLVGLFSLLPMLAGVWAFKGALGYKGDIEGLMSYLPMNVIAAVVTPFCLGLVLIFG